MKLNAAILDGVCTESLLYGVDVVGFADHAKLGATACTIACCAEVLVVVVHDGQFAVLLPEAPDAVGTEGLVAEAQKL